MGKLKNKTQLRAEILASIGNTDSLNSIEFYDDYTWSVLDCSTYSQSYVRRVGLADFASGPYDYSTKHDEKKIMESQYLS